MRRVEKTEALALLAAEAAALPARFGGCAICAIAAGHPAGLERLAENDAAVAVLDRFGVRRGHVLVVLRRHVEAIAALPWGEYAAVQRLAWEAAQALDRALAPRRVFVAALGAATALATSFPHHHVHVVPIFAGDEGDRPARVFSWSHGVVAYEAGEAAELAAALREAWP